MTPAHPAAVVLVLHGGRAQSQLPTTAADLAVVRMLPIARSIARAGRGRFAVVRLRYAVRGWNGVVTSPLGDGCQALDAMAERYPDVPIALVGHSMGGRVALRLGEEERVTHVVALAPWTGRGEQLSPHADMRLLVIHGANDRVTPPQASRQLVERLQAQGQHAVIRRAPPREARDAPLVADLGPAHRRILAPRLLLRPRRDGGWCGGAARRPSR